MRVLRPRPQLVGKQASVRQWLVQPLSRRVASAAGTVLVAVGTLLAAPSGGATTLSGRGASAFPKSTGTVVVAAQLSPYGSILEVGGVPGPGRLGGYPLYENSADKVGDFVCGTSRASALDLIGSQQVGPLSCTGPERDMLGGAGIVDWPALTTTGAPVAGRGVNPHLLGSTYRPGIGRQLAYAGHPLYLFHSDQPPAGGATDYGEGFLETVLPMPPWHVLWDLVSATDGMPQPGPASVETETLPGGRKVLAAAEFPNALEGAVTVYSYSLDREGRSACTGACAVDWIPLLTDGAPHASLGVTAKDLSFVRRSGGEDQVTYQGKPLYLYSREKFVFPPAVEVPQTTGTLGNGDGVKWSGGGAFSVV
ncbi:MAG TPA: hypothetical protein VK425_06020, partial [Acidimicrobiales bacterium]|nr:hypothetical protein [Acidimicrobiales bacterium]